MKAQKKKTSVAKMRVSGNPDTRGGVVSAKSVYSPSSESGEVVKFAETGMPQLEVWLEDETIWLTQKQMAELFGCAMENVIHHLKNIYGEEELTE